MQLTPKSLTLGGRDLHREVCTPLHRCRGAPFRLARPHKRHRVHALAAASATTAGGPSTPDPRYKYAPKVFTSQPGEKFLFQTGESMAVHELPAGTRVVYLGMRADADSDRDSWRRRIRAAFDSPLAGDPLRERLRRIKAKSANPKVVMAFDDVSVPLPPMQSPDLRAIIMEEAEQMCIEEGVTDIRFICSVALHRFIRPDEFKHLCGKRLYDKYYPQGRMYNTNAVDLDRNQLIGTTRHGEDVLVCKEFIEADLAVYANVNYVSMDGGYKSYATGMVHYNTLRYNHDCKTLCDTKSLYDPPRSALHKSINRIGKKIQEEVDIFHVETVVDEQLFPWYLSWVLILIRDQAPWQRLFMTVTLAALRVLPLWVRKWTFWSPLSWGPYGLVQVEAGETVAVHERTLEANFRDKVVEVEGQADVLILAPTCIGPYTKDMYLNPLLVNTYALGYYLSMYVGGTPLLKKGGVVVVVNDMPYAWDSPAHDCYREFFEQVVEPHGALDEFEKFQEDFATNQRLNDNYRNGLSPGGVHGFYMYTWAAHGMETVGKVMVVGAKDARGPNALKWDMHDDVIGAVGAAKQWLGKPDAQVTYLRAPPVGYVKVNVPDEGTAEADAGATQGNAPVAAG